MGSALTVAASGEVRRNFEMVASAWLVSMFVYIEVASAVKKLKVGRSKGRFSSWVLSSRELFR